MNRFILISGLILLVFLAGLSLAGIPKLINYQGMLTDSGGTPIDGARNLTFRIYDDTTGSGTLQWSETQSGVQVDHGLFNVVLGKSTALNLPFDKSYWLEVEVEGNVMPRIRFTNVGYAYRAQWSDTANYARSGGGGSGSPWVFRVTDGSDTTITTGGQWGIARFGNILYGNKDSTHVNLGVACATGTSGEDLKYCTVGGGHDNTARGQSATVGGGHDNTANGGSATVGGGYANTADTSYATVGGGYSNIARGGWATVGGGIGNTASGSSATVAGGENNTASGIRATVGGGGLNTASGNYATVGGGSLNTASGNYSLAAGRRAKANHLGTFVWADSSVNADFASTGNNQFLIRASGGVGIGTNSPDEILHVENSTGDNAIKIKSASACTSSIKLFEGSDYGFEFAYCGNDDMLNLWSKKFSGNEDIRMTWLKNGNVGIGTTSPQRALHISNVLRLEPRATAPASPSEGDLYVNSTDHHIYCYLNSVWKQLD